jgi:hypothetical protein
MSKLISIYDLDGRECLISTDSIIKITPMRSGGTILILQENNSVETRTELQEVKRQLGDAIV